MTQPKAWPEQPPGHVGPRDRTLTSDLKEEGGIGGSEDIGGLAPIASRVPKAQVSDLQLQGVGCGFDLEAAMEREQGPQAGGQEVLLVEEGQLGHRVTVHSADKHSHVALAHVQEC